MISIKIKIFILLLIPYTLYSQSIVNTVHNLSVSGPGTIRASSESQICIFCHTPHESHPVSPLWNRSDPGVNYTLYKSSTTQAIIGQPDGASILCLSCHDGTIALGNILSRAEDIDFSSGITTMPAGRSNLTTDLSDDHPISFVYNSSLAAADGELINPANLDWLINLENNKLQCTSCHDPHKNTYSDFLVSSSQYSDICLQCHKINYWTTASHKNSNAKWNGSGNDPWFHTPYKTVAENACENCHNPHNSGLDQRLLNSHIEENNCLHCHNGNVAEKNIQRELNKAYSHNVYRYNLNHDAAESTLALTQHVECEDCHNPHAANDLSAIAPFVKGSNIGTRGISLSGTEVQRVQFEYEICFRCHADSPTKPASPVPRMIEQNNVRLEFNLGNPSFHPIEGPGVNPDVPSLIDPLNESSVIYCTDCHASDGSGSPAGPHGSIYPQILKYNYDRDGSRWDNTYLAYELCYSCHDMAIVRNSHVIIKDSHAEISSCNTCHDPHGISNSQGNSVNNSNLINFNLNYVKPYDNVIEYIDLGIGHGSCQLRCHDHDHKPATY